jgi:hypothetical protein
MVECSLFTAETVQSSSAVDRFEARRGAGGESESASGGTDQRAYEDSKAGSEGAGDL